jgi:WD40 repeat protein
MRVQAEVKSTDLTTRLRERREARALEREATARSLEVERPGRLDTRQISIPGSLAENPEISAENAVETMSESIGDLELKFVKSGDVQNWSVSLNIVSAVDLPQNVVPNMPLCPVLKVGLVKVPTGAPNDPSDVIFGKLGNKSVSMIQSARVRSTTSKILSKRDNGTVDFHQQLRWDDVQEPNQVALFVELSASAAKTPTNLEESPAPLLRQDAFRVPVVEGRSDVSGIQTDEKGDPMRILNRNHSGESGGLRAFWRKATDTGRKAAELQAAEAAAAVARMIIEQDKEKSEMVIQAKSQSEKKSSSPLFKITASPQSDYDVTLQPSTKNNMDTILTEDLRLGALVIPLKSLPLEIATDNNDIARVEQWHQFKWASDPSVDSNWTRPSVLLQVSLSSPEKMNKSEAEFDDEKQLEDDKRESLEKTASTRMSMMSPSFGCRSVEKPSDDTNDEEPVLEPGIIDFISIVGCRDIGNQKNDTGHKGWVESTPECVVLEQFPPDNEFHQRSGRNALLPEMLQWFCFPEGSRLWRGTAPPSYTDLNLKRFSASSPPNIASSIATFDACLNCTTSFSWFVIASNSDKYGSKSVKTYGTVIRFYAPAPIGVDPTQEDFARTVIGNQKKSPSNGLRKRLWVPVGICLTSNLPIVGIMEAILLRICEELVTKVGTCTNHPPRLDEIHSSLSNLIVNFQKPIAGAVNCSVPFLSGSRFLLSLPPPTGLPSLPHGRAVASVCRLLGAEGLNFMLAAVLTECKILIHSQDIADIAMVAEVITALSYPFTWSLPYIPILPVGMLEFVEAPLSFILGIPTCNLQLIDPYALEELVVVDLDNGFSPADYFESRRSPRTERKGPTPLPTNVATNISKAWYRLLRAEEEVEEEFGHTLLGEESLPRLETESLAEREFRISVAIEICGLLRGYDHCVGPVFNRDKFLKIAPALYEERRASRGVGVSVSRSSQSKSISPRSKRFLSLLVNTQNFQQLLESLESDEASLFHEIMDIFDDSSSDNKSTVRVDAGASMPEKPLAQLAKTLQKAEDKIPTYRVEETDDLGSGDPNNDDDLFFDEIDGSFQDFDDFSDAVVDTSSSDVNMISSFTDTLLAPIDRPPIPDTDGNAVSMEYIQKLESNPWEYQSLFKIQTKSLLEKNEKVKLREAIGERRFRAWKMAQDQKAGEVDLSFISESLRASNPGTSIDLTSLISSATSETAETESLSSTSSSLRTSTLTSEQQRVVDAKNRDVIRRCLDKANVGNEKIYGTEGNDGLQHNPFLENGRDLMAESEKALQNPSAQRFLLSILAQRSRLENQRARTMRHRQPTTMSSVSRLGSKSFECLVRFSCAMLDSCMEYKEYEPAYRLLANTAGFITVLEKDDGEDREGDIHSKHVVSMTSRIGLHPIFADLGVWRAVMSLHLADRESEKRFELASSDVESEDEDYDELEYEAAVATLYEMVGYGIPGEELSRFAMKASEEHGWFCDDRGRQLLMLARRISVRRDQADINGAVDTGDIELIRKGKDDTTTILRNIVDEEEEAHEWVNIGWCHPAAPSSVMSEHSDLEVSSSEKMYMKRSPVTTLASFGSSLVVTGGLDGSVFLAHSMKAGEGREGEDPEVRGIHLDWGSASRAGAGSSSDGEYGVGAVSCIAAAHGSGHHASTYTKKDSGDTFHSNMLASTEGSRVIAGTTAGDLRVWSVKDIYSAVLMAKEGDDSGFEPKMTTGGGNALKRLKFSLRGRALSGHRGGVTCIDVPSHLYRPDSLVTGGADGLIKLWSLRAPSSGRRSTIIPQSVRESENGVQQRGRRGDALSVLTGHSRRVTCIQTAWHGDRLLSGSADRTLRVWDLAGSSGKCLHKLSGHTGWITMVRYWGPNTIISASTDRSIALWDARVRDSPLFMLRHHQAPLSDLLVGSRTNPMMVSAAADGTIANWDFRTLSASSSCENNTSKSDSSKNCQIVRRPGTTMRHGSESESGAADSAVRLARGLSNSKQSIYSVGSDAIVKEWDMITGNLLGESPSGHCDAITSFGSFGHSEKKNINMLSNANSRVSTLTSSSDGTIRMRTLIRKEERD